jgi:hypothetical protein
MINYRVKIHDLVQKYEYGIPYSTYKGKIWSFNIPSKWFIISQLTQ